MCITFVCVCVCVYYHFYLMSSTPYMMVWNFPSLSLFNPPSYMYICVYDEWLYLGVCVCESLSHAGVLSVCMWSCHMFSTIIKSSLTLQKQLLRIFFPNAWRRYILVWFGFFVWWHINLYRVFNAKDIHLDEQYLTHRWEDEWVHTFPNGICPKLNVLKRLEFELAYYDSQSSALTITPRRHPAIHLGY